MKLSQYTKTLLSVLWNIMTFLCSSISLNNTTEKKTPFFPDFVLIDNYLFSIYKILKELINKKILKNKNNTTAETSVVPNNIYKNKNSVSSRINTNNIIINQAQQCVNLLYIKKLKDALATQILISKQYTFRMKDKCAYFSPFAMQDYHCLYIF